MSFFKALIVATTLTRVTPASVLPNSGEVPIVCVLTSKMAYSPDGIGAQSDFVINLSTKQILLSPYFSRPLQRNRQEVVWTNFMDDPQNGVRQRYSLNMDSMHFSYQGTYISGKREGIGSGTCRVTSLDELQSFH